MLDHDISQRRACKLVGVDPKTVRRDKPPDSPEVRKEMKAIASKRRRFGYRRLHILLKREGWQVNWKKLYRIYREEGLTVRIRGGRKRAVGTRAPMAIPQGPNQRWSLDFVSDSLSCGRRFRILNVIDDFSRECLAAVVDTSLSGDRVGRELDRIAEMRGYPCMVVSDNGTELTSNAILKCKPPPRAVWLLSCEIVYRVSLWTHTKTPPAFKFCRFLIPAAAGVGLMTKRSELLKKALATA